MAKTTLTLEMRLKWWFRPALAVLFIGARLGFCPSEEFLHRLVTAGFVPVVQ